jgi:hypothetical protein
LSWGLSINFHVFFFSITSISSSIAFLQLSFFTTYSKFSSSTTQKLILHKYHPISSILLDLNLEMLNLSLEMMVSLMMKLNLMMGECCHHCFHFLELIFNVKQPWEQVDLQLDLTGNSILFSRQTKHLDWWLLCWSSNCIAYSPLTLSYNQQICTSHLSHPTCIFSPLGFEHNKYNQIL